jgi:uncharacterized protein DUF3859
MIRLIVAAIALIIMSIGFAHAETVRNIEIYEHGIYDSPEGVDVGLSRQGVVNAELDHIELLQSTRTVVAGIGVQFGFRFRIIGEPDGAPVPITITMKFPEPGITALDSPRRFVDDDFSYVQAVNSEDFYTFTFDRAEEMVPGLWTFEVWVGDRKFGEETFIVILPPIS